MFWRLFITFFRIGAFTIGGGYAMLPLIRRDVVEHNCWLSDEEFVDMIAIAQSAPGVLAVNSAIIIGYKIKRVPGALAAALGASLPSFTIILFIASFWVKFNNNPYLEAFMSGARPAVIALLVNAALSMGRTAVKGRRGLILGASGLIAVSFLGLHPIFAIIFAGIFGYFFLLPHEKGERG